MTYIAMAPHCTLTVHDTNTTCSTHTSWSRWDRCWLLVPVGSRLPCAISDPTKQASPHACCAIPGQTCSYSDISQLAIERTLSPACLNELAAKVRLVPAALPRKYSVPSAVQARMQDWASIHSNSGVDLCSRGEAGISAGADQHIGNGLFVSPYHQQFIGTDL